MSLQLCDQDDKFRRGRAAFCGGRWSTLRAVASKRRQQLGVNKLLTSPSRAVNAVRARRIHDGIAAVACLGVQRSRVSPAWCWPRDRTGVH